MVIAYMVQFVGRLPLLSPIVDLFLDHVLNRFLQHGTNDFYT